MKKYTIFYWSQNDFYEQYAATHTIRYVGSVLTLELYNQEGQIVGYYVGFQAFEIEADS